MTVIALRTPLAAPVLPRLTSARAEVAAVQELGLEQVDLDDLGTALEQLAALEAQVQAVRLTVLAEAECRRVADSCAATGTDSWAAGLTGDRREAMRGGLLLARDLEERFHHVRDAFAAGRINLAQVRIVVDACRQVPDAATPQQCSDAEQWAVAKASGAANRSGKPMQPKRLRQVVRRMFDPIDRELADQHEAIMLGRQRRRADRECFFAFGDDGDGTFSGKFRIPELHGRLLLHALQRLSAPRRLGRDRDGRTVVDETVEPLGTAELHGHAFCELLEHLPTDGHGPVGATVLVTVGLAELQQRLADHLVPLDAVNAWHGSTETGTGRLDTGTRIGVGDVRRMACGAGIVPVVMGGEGQPLDVGRERRLHTRAQRQALAVVHDTCAARGCDRPFAWCEVHHPHAWSEGGDTSLDNAVPLCAHHHRRAHDPTWRLQRHGDGSWRFRRRT